MEKYTQKYQREMEELELVMNQKLDRLNIFLKERLHEKRSNRDKLSDIKEDILKYKMNKEEVWNKVGTNSGTMKTSWMEECVGLEDLIAKSKSTV